MYLKDKKWNRKYPDHVEIAGVWANSSHVLTVSEGRFFPIEGGYVLLASVAAINGFTKTELFSPGCLMSLEIHRTKYTANVPNKEGGGYKDQEIDPTEVEVLLCNWLDNMRSLEENPVDKCFSATFSINDSSILARMMKAEEHDKNICLLEHLNYVEPKLIKELPKSAANGGGFSKGSSYTEKQKAEQRAEFIIAQVAAYFDVTNELKDAKNLKSVSTLLAGLATTDYMEYLALWQCISLALGISGATSSDMGIPFRSTRIADIDRSGLEPRF